MVAKRSGPTLCCLFLMLAVRAVSAQDQPAQILSPKASQPEPRTAFSEGSGVSGSAPGYSPDERLPAMKLTLDRFLELVHKATLPLSTREIDALAAAARAWSQQSRSEAVARQDRLWQASHSLQLDELATDTFYDCLEAQMTVEIEQRAFQRAQLFLPRTQQMEGNLAAPHSDVAKAELTLDQRREALEEASYRNSTCEGHFALFLSESVSSFELVPPVFSTLPNRDAFLRGVAVAPRSLMTALVVGTDQNAAAPSLSNRIFLDRIMEAYDEATFDAGAAKRLQGIRAEGQQNEILAENRYRGGEASIYDVTSAQETAVAADLAWVRGSVRALRARGYVDRLTGKEGGS